MEKFIVDKYELEDHRRFEATLSNETRLYVFDRDNWACRRCNKSENIAPHHIKYRSDKVDHHPDNLVTLCHKCHRRVHDGFAWIYVNSKGDFFFGGTRSDIFTIRQDK